MNSLALTRAQELMWLGQKLHETAALYNMPFTFEIDGAINPEIFQRAFERLVAANDNLRTVIREVGDTPRQVIHDNIPALTELIDLSGEPNPSQAFADWVDSRRARLFQMDRCLYDSVLLKLGERSWVWFFSQHHMVMDVRSAQLIYRQMSDLYRQMMAGETPDGVPAPSFARYVDYEGVTQTKPEYAAASAYWQEKIANPPAPVRLYGGGVGSTSTRAVRRVVPLDDTRMARLRELAQRPGFRGLNPDWTYSNLFASLLLAMVYRLSESDSARLGFPYANRSLPEFRETPGMFVEVLALDVDFDPAERFASLYKKVAAENLRALQQLQPAVSDAALNRSYNVLLNYITVTFPDFAGMPTRKSWLHAGHGDSNHHLRLQVHDIDGRGGFDLCFDFNTRVFSETDQDRAIRHFLRMFDAYVSDPERAIGTIPLLAGDEYQRFFVDFNATETPYPSDRTVIDLFEEQARQTPDRAAIALDDHTLTFAEANALANRAAADLRERGVGVGSLVPVCVEHSIDLVIALLAILKAGGAYVPLDPSHPDSRIAGILDDLGDPLIVTQPHLRPRFGADAPVYAIDLAAFPRELVPNPPHAASPDDLVYVIYTSGTTGKPKGVMIRHVGLTNYLWWACKQYTDETPTSFALYSSLAFDLTVTSVFVPLISGGTIRIYPDHGRRGTVIRDVFLDNRVDVVKLTPSHMALARDLDLSQTRVKRLIVGGEDFKTEVARAVHRATNGRIEQFNEYGPTEATVACMIHRFDANSDTRASVPIGAPSDNMRVYILDRFMQPTPPGVIGEMVLAGVNVAKGYLNRADLTEQRFLDDPFVPGERMYRTGDLARWLDSGQLEFLGRADHQVKVGGARIELGEVEAALLSHPAVAEAVVDVRTSGAHPIEADAAERSLQRCVRCGLPANYPGVTYDAAGVCNTCRSFEGYRDRAAQYFKPFNELEGLAVRIKARATGQYDVLALLSGGKDSTYMLYHLVNMGLRVLSFTLDNGYISEAAKGNIGRVTEALGVDHVYGETPFMKAIFVDSLHQFANVCNGCFKTIYTMAGNVAREKGIRTIVTGLSRGQFFETRLTEELFTGDRFNADDIDAGIAKMRQAYHQRDDLISRSLQVDVFRDGALFEDVEFVDFYRYCDVDLAEMYAFLESRGLWSRPPDTGRSTNCLINEVGIYVHKLKRGFHNYALPYSWDVRLGHKTRDEAVSELEDEIDPERVKRILREIGYDAPLTADKGEDARLVAYFVAEAPVDVNDLRAYLATRLPDFMIPSHFVQLEKMPLAPSGKVDRAALPAVENRAAGGFAAPTTDAEQVIAGIWQDVLLIERVGIHDDFFALGGHSLPAIRIVARINDAFEMTLPLEVFFANPTVAGLAAAVEQILISEIAVLSDEEIEALLRDRDETG